jgi:hypothetical protein
MFDLEFSKVFVKTATKYFKNNKQLQSSLKNQFCYYPKTHSQFPSNLTKSQPKTTKMCGQVGLLAIGELSGNLAMTKKLPKSYASSLEHIQDQPKSTNPNHK